MSEKIMTTSERAHAVADDLIGTAGDLNQHATAEEINDHKFCAALDALIFSCEVCGWWCGIEEMIKDEICQECFSDEEE